MLLSDEVRPDAGLLLGQGHGGARGCEALDHPGHVAAQSAHGLKTFRVLTHFVRSVAVHHVPVDGGNNGHLGNGEILVERVKGGR